MIDGWVHKEYANLNKVSVFEKLNTSLRNKQLDMNFWNVAPTFHIEQPLTQVPKFSYLIHGWAWAGWFWLQQGHLSQNSSKNVFFFVKSILQPELWKTESQSLTKLLLLLKHDLRSRHGKRQFFLHEQGLSQNYFTQKSAWIATKSEFATKQR